MCWRCAVAERRRYDPPSDVLNVPQLRAQASRRRLALVTGGCSTYQLGTRDGVAAIICLCCGLGSANRHDIAERYCGFCHEFHSEWRDEHA